VLNAFIILNEKFKGFLGKGSQLNGLLLVTVILKIKLGKLGLFT
jgi:hypothetical protein